MQEPTPRERDVLAYYRSALFALRFLESQHPTGRRFGSEADARWSAFRGDLDARHRIDLLIRDADFEWPSSFGARAVFAKEAVAEDEPFGADWPGMLTDDAETMWRQVAKERPPASIRETLEACARCWEVPLARFEAPAIQAEQKLAVAGPSAIVAIACAFVGRSELDLADQTIVIATPPAHRQLALLGAALAGSPKRLELLRASSAALIGGRRVIVSDDADATDRARAKEIGSAR